MEKNEQDALKGNQQAMVNLLANHIALTMGLPRGKVPRVSYQMFQEAQQSAPILQRAEAHFDKDGYLTGVVLSPDQMKAMVALAHETRDAEWQSSNSSADYIGIDPNDRTEIHLSGCGQRRNAARPGSREQLRAVIALKAGIPLTKIAGRRLSEQQRHPGQLMPGQDQQGPWAKYAGKPGATTANNSVENAAPKLEGSPLERGVSGAIAGTEALIARPTSRPESWAHAGKCGGHGNRRSGSEGHRQCIPELPRESKDRAGSDSISGERDRKHGWLGFSGD